MPTKRSISPPPSLTKKLKVSDNFEEYYKPDPRYYPNPITWKQANAFNTGKRPKPIDLLNNHIKSQKLDSKTSIDTVVHWFRTDLRLGDSAGLFHAVKQLQAAQNKSNKDARLMALYIINEHDFRAHLDSGWKLRFALDALESLRESLRKLNVPLIVRLFEPKEALLSRSSEFATWFKDLCLGLVNKKSSKSGAVLVTANAQYETDELYRDVNIFGHCDSQFHFQVYHDQCTVVPGALTTGKGSQYTVFTPWYKKWVEYLKTNQSGKDAVATFSFDTSKPLNADLEALESCDYVLPEEFVSYLPNEHLDIPPATEQDAHEVLEHFFKSKKVHDYNEKKDILNLDNTSHLSCYITSGLISTRAVVNRGYHENGNSLMHKDIKQNNSVENFAKEVAWRDFYKHIMCNWPYTSMDVAFKFETMDIKWENDPEKFRKWCVGETGLPIVDAIQRKLLYTGYISNRCRMITASFLSKNLLVDWRWGERWFRKHLLDADLASNSGGWGFSSSTGVDCQPYFRVFNMKLQSEKYDPKGAFVREWVPELKDIDNIKILREGISNATKANGYSQPIVDLKDSREKALEAFREAM
ncbi:LAME_0H03862g1_1 [Lachancea meyersii CBS 8951]|uniref:LAME_0H03862g1_1 n=1 Tax=Lachancea meyersii CBS 8951 TaxID=1266667 RepID=A0A1G4KDV7_9SACH|nr:LAME_0H03862g1_1 [Lachancea meyersii CBS 8951]